MPTVYRRDEQVVDHMGNGVSGVSVYLCDQPANTTNIPPSPQAKIYSDPAGVNEITQPVHTDAYGRVSYYAISGIYTCVYTSPQILGQTLVLTDQIISNPTNLPQFNSDSTTAGTIKPVPDGAQVAFTLSAPPNPPSSLILAVNGAVLNSYAFANSTVVLETAPTLGSVITATYQV